MPTFPFKLFLSIAILLALSNSGLSSAQNPRWERLGPEGGKINVIAIDPIATQTIYAGTNGGGIFKSTDGAKSWAPINSGLTGINARNIKVLVINPKTPTTIYVSTDYDLFKSTDGGVKWFKIGKPVECLVVDPHMPQTIYVGNDRGISKSIDGGTTWRETNDGIQGDYSTGRASGGEIHLGISTLAIDAMTPQTIYAGFGDGGLFKSTDGAKNWKMIRKDTEYFNPVKALTIDPQAPHILYAAAWKGFFKSTNGGNDWKQFQSLEKRYSISRDGKEEKEEPVDVLERVDHIVIDPKTPSTIFAAGNHLLKSSDGGISWNEIKTGITYSNTGAFAIDPASPEILYAGSLFGGGVSKSIDSGNNWSKVNTGLTATTVYDLTMDPASPQTLYATTVEGVFKSEDKGGHWNLFSSGLRYDYIRILKVDPQSPQTFYAGGFFGQLLKSVDGGRNWKWCELEPEPHTPTAMSLATTNPVPVFSIAIDPRTSKTIYVTNGKGIYKSTDGGNKWRLIDEDIEGIITIDPITPQKLYVSSRESIYKSSDGGKNWSSISLASIRRKMTKTRKVPFDRETFMSVVIDPKLPGTLYAGSYGEDHPSAPYEGGIFKSSDEGKTWSALTMGLPDVDISALLLDPQMPQRLYAGTSDGRLFKSVDGGSHWSAIETPFAGNSIISLEILQDEQKTVYVGTDGLGIFRYIDTDSLQAVK
jgi:photosystem II stability/assembly factor-like uncharacterized protein